MIQAPNEREKHHVGPLAVKWPGVYGKSALYGQKPSTSAGNNVLEKFYIKDVPF